MVPDLVPKKRFGPDAAWGPHPPSTVLDRAECFLIFGAPHVTGRVGPGLRIVTLEEAARYILPHVVDNAFERLAFVDQPPLYDEPVLFEMSNLFVAEGRRAVREVRILEDLCASPMTISWGISRKHGCLGISIVSPIALDEIAVRYDDMISE